MVYTVICTILPGFFFCLFRFWVFFVGLFVGLGGIFLFFVVGFYCFVGFVLSLFLLFWFGFNTKPNHVSFSES